MDGLKGIADVIMGSISIWDAEESALFLLLVEGMSAKERREWNAVRGKTLMAWAVTKLGELYGVGPAEGSMMARVTERMVGRPGDIGRGGRQW